MAFRPQKIVLIDFRESWETNTILINLLVRVDQRFVVQLGQGSRCNNKFRTNWHSCLIGGETFKLLVAKGFQDNRKIKTFECKSLCFIWHKHKCRPQQYSCSLAQAHMQATTTGLIFSFNTFLRPIILGRGHECQKY